jgi:Tfp pilus assembly protein PilF
MTRPGTLIGVLMASVAIPALAQTPTPAGFAPTAAPPAPAPQATSAAAVESGSAVSTLIRQADRWLSQNRPDLASLSIGRALAAEPTNAEALQMAARVETVRGNRDAALGYLRRAQAAGGTEAQRAETAAALRAASLDPTALAQARQAARDGHADEAATRYRALFGAAGPPPDYAREYYQALAGSSGTRAEGLAGLNRLAGTPNADSSTLLAAAEALTYQESTRVEGITRLSALADRADTAEEAKRGWRQALGYMGSNPGAAPLIEAYLRRFPNDAELTQRLASLRQAPVAAPDPNDALRREGFAQLETGDLRNSADRFTKALAVNPNDADALGGLGLVRLRQNQPEAARPLLERATAADPTHAAQWQKALDGAVYGMALADARTRLRQGDAAGADTLLRDALRRDVPDHTDAESLLGDTALKQNDPAAAEQHYRTALSRRPGFPPAVTGLNQALRAQGKLPPEPIRAAAPAAGAAAIPSSSSQIPAPDSRVGQLRAEAAQVTDSNVAITLLRSGVEAAPNDPWVRLDLARLLRRNGRSAEGRALVEELAARDGTPDDHFAAALLAQEDGRLDDAQSQLAVIPALRRTPDMGRLEAQIRTDRDVSRAAQSLLADAAGARQQLLLIAARPDPSGATGAAVVRAFGDASDRAGASEAARVALAANPAGGTSARLAIAGALLAAGAETEAGAMADQISQASLTADQRRDLAALRNGISIRASDRLNESGAQAQGFEKLRPVLAQDPDNVDAQLALARLYQGARQPVEALRLAQAVLARDPRNFDARQGAVEAAIAAGDRRTATTLVSDAAASGPSDSRVLFLQARVASAFGDTGRAQRLLQQALAQRQAELGTSVAAAGLDPMAATGNPFQPTIGASAVAANLPRDPLSRQIVQQLVATEATNAPTLAFAPIVHTRSGSPGLDQLSEIGTTVEGSVTAPGIGGSIIAKVEPVMINSGQVGSSLQQLYKYGTNPLYGTTPISPKNVTEAGLGLTVGYTLNDMFKLNIGTSPLGFKQPSLEGGIEFAPKLTDWLRLRFIGDRHAIQDSLLSWAGQTDPNSKVTWGAVSSSGGRAQLEIPIGPGSAYIGGGYAVMTGTHVAANSRTEAGAGFSYPVLHDGDTALTAGMNLVYFGYANNQRAFTLGNGGYFSPQSYEAINIPIDYRAKSGRFSYDLGTTFGYAAFKENASPVFPHDPNLQGQLVAAAATNPLLSATNPSLTRNGFVAGIRVALAYQLTDSLTVSGLLRYDQAPQFDETNVMVRLQQTF